MRVCTEPGCPVLVERGACATHTKAKGAVRRFHDETRPLYTKKWTAYSKRRLARFPLCVGFPAGYHGKDPVLATCTDHIESSRSRPDLFWAESNHQSLCTACNTRKGG